MWMKFCICRMALWGSIATEAGFGCSPQKDNASNNFVHILKIVKYRKLMESQIS